MKPKHLAASLLALSLSPVAAWGFCGFYVAQADTTIFNQSSKVILARQNNHTVLTMANDFRGDVREFAVVIPVPTEIHKEQVQVSESSLIDLIDTYSAPRLTQYYDEDPCPRYEEDQRAMGGAMRGVPMMEADMAAPASKSAASYGVRIEQSYSVGEYDILILSAKDSLGLETWLKQEGYRIPNGASSVLGSYIKQNMHFFVAKVNVAEHARQAQPFLRPLQVSYDSPKFMLPIRLGMVNASGPQDLFVFALTPSGRVETTNYRTTKLPSQVAVPESVQSDFKSFYKSMFDRQVSKNGMETVFTEYAWPLQIMCDPCSADPINTDQLQKMGATWVQSSYGYSQNVYLTRLHVRYDMAHFPEDLVFQETPDTSTWQAIYSIHHPFTGDTTCAAGRKYEETLAARQEQEVNNLVNLTGWDASSIRAKIPKRPNAPKKDESFWEWR